MLPASSRSAIARPRRGAARRPSRRAGRPRAGPCRCARRPRPSGLSDHPRPAGVAAQREPDGGAGDRLVLVALGVGRRAGRPAPLRDGAPRRASATGRPVGRRRCLDRGHGGPAHAEVALDGAGDRRGRDDLAGQAVLAQAGVGVELDHAVHVGGRAADVDDHDVARAGVPVVEAAGQQLDAGEHDVGGGAAHHRGEGAGRRSVRLLRCLPPITWARNISRIAARADAGGEHADAGHDVVGQHVRDAAEDRGDLGAAPRRCRPRPPGPASRRPRARGRRASSTSLLPPSVPPVSSTTSGRSAAGRASVRPAPPAAASTCTTLPPLDSATRRPASAVTSSSLPTTAIRSPPPALEQASTSAPAARGSASASRPGTRRTRRGRRRCRRPRQRGRVLGGGQQPALGEVDEQRLGERGAEVDADREVRCRLSQRRAHGRGRRRGRRRSRCRR